MQFRPRFAVSLCALAALTLLSACGPHKDPNAPLMESASPPIADVPIPVGYAMTGDSTSKVESSGLRFVDHKYDGGEDVLPVVRFYKDQMPGKGWTFVDQNQLVHNEIALHYTKNNEDCTITITPGSMHTHVRVQIDPAGRNAAR
jgi:hypothetical protein